MSEFSLGSYSTTLVLCFTGYCFDYELYIYSVTQNLQDEMMDLMDVSSEIQETLGRSYNVPDDIDDEELMGGKFLLVCFGVLSVLYSFSEIHFVALCFLSLTLFKCDGEFRT